MKIDFVVPWVDGSDPVWRREKEKYQSQKIDDSNCVNRFRDWNLMKYWFRSVEKFVPWVEKIHFITWGHVPAFLNCNHPKLHIIRHENYMPQNALPTFSSHALEVNLHRIDGLSEHFVYLNDDTFIIRPMAETKFFKNGLPCTFGAEMPMAFTGNPGIWQYAAVNDLCIINRHFEKKKQTAKFRKKYVSSHYRWQDNVRTLAMEKMFPDGFAGFKNLHAPAAYMKTTFEEVWQAEPEILEHTTMHRFRQADDVNQWVMLWWQVASGNFSPAIIDSQTLPVMDKNIDSICRAILNQSSDMVCLNDSETDNSFEINSRKIKAAFEKILPEKCGFEK